MKQLQPLKPKSGTVHCVLRVVAERLDQLLSLASAPPSVATTGEAQETLGLRLHVAPIPGDDVSADEQLAQAL